MQLQTVLGYSYCLWHDLYNIVFKIKHNITTWLYPPHDLMKNSGYTPTAAILSSVQNREF
jgi:hypothetical protein